MHDRTAIVQPRIVLIRGRDWSDDGLNQWADSTVRSAGTRLQVVMDHRFPPFKFPTSARRRLPHPNCHDHASFKFGSRFESELVIPLAEPHPMCRFSQWTT